MFLLRIEDTDRERSTEVAVDAILDGLRWLELDWDGEPLFQFARAARHAEIAHHAARRGQRLSLLRDARGVGADARARQRGRPFDRAMTASGATATRPRPRKARPSPCASRRPKTGETVIEDKVQGRVVFPNKDLDDLIILRSQRHADL